MRVIIQDTVSHNFIEGPIQSTPSSTSSHQGTSDMPTNPTAPTQAQQTQGIVNEADTEFQQANERYD